MPSLYLYLIGGVALLGVGFGGGFYVDNRLTQDKIIQLSGDLATAKGNAITLGKGLDACNTSVDGIATAGKALTAAAQLLADQAKAGQQSLATNAKALNAVKSSAEKCPVADAIMEAGFQ